MQHLTRPEKSALTGLLVAAAVLRIAAVALQFEQLAVDRDGYVEIASHLAQGDGFALTNGDAAPPQPTAYRPPLYPVLLSLLFRLGMRETGIALLHVLLGVLTVLLTYVTGRRLGLDSFAWLAAAIVAVDPLLLAYTAQPMTETLCTFLIILLLTLVTRPAVARPGGSDTSGVVAAPAMPPAAAPLRFWLIGAVFGLALLCRPTVGAFGVCVIVWWLVKRLRTGSFRPVSGWQVAVAAAIVVAPWVIRNGIVIGRATPATTHGGYTLLLGNNPIFYRHVVAQPWGTGWDDADQDFTQSAWLKDVEAAIHADLGEQAAHEPARDHWMYHRALENIRAQPEMFLRACLLRFVRFWNVVPLSPSRGGLPRPAVGAIGLFYLLFTLSFLIGVVVIWRQRNAAWIPLLLMIFAFSLVHLFYWSNMRMRAPVIPAIALVAAAGFRSVVRRSQQPGQTRNPAAGGAS